jgi:hypothetical protein
MKRVWLTLGLLLGVGGAAMAQDATCPMATGPKTTVHIVKQQRGFFNALRVNKNLPRQVCGGADPIDVRTFHTAGDGFAAVFTAILYTPAHLRVVCPG